MKKLLLLSISSLILGCSGPYHYNDTSSKKPIELATLSFDAGEVLMLSLDDKKFTGKTNAAGSGKEFYINPGKHKITAKLNWNTILYAGNIPFTNTLKNPLIKTFCFQAIAGNDYVLGAKNPGPNWTISIDTFRLKTFRISDQEPVSCN